MKGQKMMYSYRWKVFGMLTAAISFTLLVIQKYTDFIIISRFNSDQHFNILLWVVVFGLFIMMYSYEKQEDERVKAIRAKSIMLVFMVMFGATMAFGLTMSIVAAEEMEPTTFSQQDMIEMSRILMYYPACAVVLYHIIFQMGLHFDDEWDYNDDSSVLENIRRHPWRILARIIVSTIIIWLIFKFIAS
jgi:hypothetical protein